MRLKSYNANPSSYQSLALISFDRKPSAGARSCNYYKLRKSSCWSSPYVKCPSVFQIAPGSNCFLIIMSEIRRCSWAAVRPVFIELCCFLRPETVLFRHLICHKFVLCLISDKPLGSCLMVWQPFGLFFFRQSNDFKHSDKPSLWTNLACFIKVYGTELMTPQLAIRNARFAIKVELPKKMTCCLS